MKNSIFRQWCVLLICLMVLFVPTVTQAQAQMFWPFDKVDTDEDNVDDNTEAYLIDLYRPLYKYDVDETFWPSSVTWHAAHSALERNSRTLFTEAEMATDPENALRGHLRDAGNPNPFRASSGEYYPFNSDYRMDINNNFRQGEGHADVPGGHRPAEEMRTLGVFANVQLITTPVQYEGGFRLSASDQLPLYLIQYWQFFSFNDAGGLGDHEGDWVFLDVYCAPDATQPSGYRLVALVYHHHGDGNCAPGNATGSELPSDNIPVCYLEDDSHEWYNFAGTSCTVTNAHGGGGVTYRVENVINLGQRFAPMSRSNDTDAVRLERRLALFYNGDWGKYTNGAGTDCPPGPAFQNRSMALGIWSVPRPLWVGYVGAIQPIPSFEPYTSDTPGYGTRYYPFLKVEDALAAGTNGLGIKDQGVVRILTSATDYTVPTNSGNLRRITQPMRLVAKGTGIARLRAVAP